MSQFFAWSSEWLWLFAFILTLPWLIRWLLPPAPRKKNTALKVPFYNDIVNLTNKNKQLDKKSHWKIQNLAWLIWLLLVLAAMRPQWLGEPIQIQISGRDLLLAIDLSESMAETDLEGTQDCQSEVDLERTRSNRLSIVKSVLSEFIERRKGDRVGLIVFGTKAYMQTPLTFDRMTVKAVLEKETFIGLAGKKTAIGDAIGLAVKHLRERSQKKQILILLTDGSNTAGKINPLRAAKLAKKYGVHIYTIGVGVNKICVHNEFGSHLEETSFDLDEKMLQKIAELTSAQYFRARNRAELENIYKALDQYEPVKEEYKTIRHKTPLYPWFLGIAFFMSLILLVLQIQSGKKH